jgi:hypothetical protein
MNGKLSENCEGTWGSGCLNSTSWLRWNRNSERWNPRFHFAFWKRTFHVNAFREAPLTLREGGVWERWAGERGKEIW